MASEVTPVGEADIRSNNRKDSSDSRILTAPENGGHFNDSSGQLVETGCSQSKTCVPTLGDENPQPPKSDTIPERGPKHQHKGMEQYKAMHKRMHKLALDMIAAQFEHVYDDTNEPGDVIGSADTDKSSTSDSEKKKIHTSTGKDDISLISYRAEFYEYIGPSLMGNEIRPELRKTVVKHKPIAVTLADLRNEDHSFDVTSMYAIPKYADTTHTRKLLSGGILAELGTYITIRSKVLKESLENIAPYYPMVPFDKDELVLREPFCILLHYRQELAERRGVLERAVRESQNHDSVELDHLTYVVNFVQQRYAEAMLQEEMRHQEPRAMCTFDWLWLLFRPGTVVYSWQDGLLRAFVVESHDREPKNEHKTKPNTISKLDDLERKPIQLRITVWFLNFDGDHIGRCRSEYCITPFDGAKPILSLPIFPKEYMKKDNQLHVSLSTEEYLIRRGQLFCELTRRSYRHYDGETVQFPKRTIRGRVMIDMKYFMDTTMVARTEVGLSSKEEPRRVNYGGKFGEHWKPKDPYKHYDDISPEGCGSLDSQQYMICNYRVWAYVLQTRSVEMLYVMNISRPVFQVDLIKDLVLDDDAKAMIKALSQRYTMQKGTEQAWRADFVNNKGEGQIFLLHGKPGVGKTTTAECVAELTQRPLLSITCGDLGVDPEKVERKLGLWLKQAELWGAVLLLDEADVYLESRITQDLQRNTLVSIFLRALEYYQGLLFLTTNRVGTFDPAFVSRIHVVIHYPDFTNEKRGQIWDIFFNKLERERENLKFTQRTVDYAKESKEIQSLGWNGREIRNAFSTAVALAEYENERDPKGKVIFHARHLEQVVKMSRAFQDYLKSTHGMSQEEQARRSQIRNDYWKGPNDLSGSPSTGR